MDQDATLAWAALHQANEEQEKLLKDNDDSMLRMLRTENPSVLSLSDGDWHVCEREHCPYASVDPMNHIHFCSLSGLCWGTEFLMGSDPTWTGRSTTTCDQDAVSGTPLGGWRPRRDAFVESKRAFQAAANISDKEVTYVETQRERDFKNTRLNQKRGALCVDQAVEATLAPTKSRVFKLKNTTESHEKLSLEVSIIIDKLMSVKKDASCCPKSVSGNAVDVRLQNPEFVVKASIHQMIKRACAGEDVINYSRLHDIVVHANAFAKRKREEAARKTCTASTKRRKGFAGDTKKRIINLVISLWKAACESDYLSQESKRGADGFRPFVCGILYAFKRGVCLADGLEIVPEMPFIADQLPTLRSHDATHAARQLQSSSHRGLCCLHRSIASFETADTNSCNYITVRRAFESAAIVAAYLKAHF